jgi:hypothetical protein
MMLTVVFDFSKLVAGIAVKLEQLSSQQKVTTSL